MQHKDEGNTSPHPMPDKCRKYGFTLNNWTVNEYLTILETFKVKTWTYVIGKEHAGTTGTPHLQGYFDHKNAVSFNTVKNILPRAHIFKAKGTRKQNFVYCTKELDYVTNMEFPPPARPIIDPLAGKDLYDFQNDIIEMIKTPAVGNRNIYWFWDSKGCRGKTTLAKHICMNYNALYVQGKSSDIKYGVLDVIQKRGEIDIVIMGIPRTYESYVSYDAIESIKDGIFYSSKYESGMVIFNPPHVIILANFKPDINTLSKDRWIVKCLDEVVTE